MVPPTYQGAVAPDDAGADVAAASARAVIETALQGRTAAQRDQFWSAIGLYYSTRRHPGAAEAAVAGVPPTG